MSSKPDNILVLAPHTDDGELGCGGSIAKFCYEGATVWYIAFSYIPEFNNGILKIEVQQSADVFGINLLVKDFPVRHFTEHRQEILDFLVYINAIYPPGIVFVPARQDVHQDHQVITDEALRVFKHTTILGYELPWNNFAMDNTVFIPLSKSFMKKKIEAIACYKSQINHLYMSSDIIYSLAKIRGLQIGIEYAESFTVFRWIL